MLRRIQAWALRSSVYVRYGDEVVDLIGWCPSVYYGIWESNFRSVGVL